ncbi:helicase-related protein [Sphingomonas sp. CJ99]
MVTSAQDARARVLDRLEGDLIGPKGGADEVIDERPSARYLTGILFPQQSTFSEDEDEQISEEQGAGDSEEESAEATSLLRTFKPATCGFSFSVVLDNPDATVELTVAFARYRSSEHKGGHGRRLDWQRIPYDLPTVTIDLAASADEQVLADGLVMHRRVRRDGARATITLQFVNMYRELSRDATPAAEPDPLAVTGMIESEEASFFQFTADVRCGDGCRFVPRRRGFRGNDEDERISDLIYRDCAEYAVGHTASAAWTPSDEPERIALAWFPRAVVRSMDADGDELLRGAIAATTLGRLHGLELAQAPDDALFEALASVATGYEDWIAQQDAAVQADQTLSDTLRGQADANLQRCRRAAERIRDGLAFLRGDGRAIEAFRLANRGMYIQAAWGAGRKNAHEDLDPDAYRFHWRPFQLAFTLMCLPSTAERGHAERGIFDLIWFPTGGGKTEAYLLLSAFTLFYRRLRYGLRGVGAAVMMRYTLRTLTVQQFQRAAALVTACEQLRLDRAATLGAQRFSIGLWVGGDSTPNRYSDAVDALGDFDAKSTPRQLTRCPICRTTLEWENDRSRRRIACRCPDAACRAMRPGGAVPVITVDDDLYAEPPSILIGTVDKFAQIVGKSESGVLFGVGGNVEPPDLIIQDELHLIGGPLGSLTGLYETAVDRLCSTPAGGPKIIGSTATIRRAEDQVRNVFNRTAFQFPPPAVDWSNSCFAKVKADDPGRLYVGLTTAGRSEKFALQAASASLLQSGADADLAGNVHFDGYATLVAYFNSLKVLGGALVLMEDDVRITIAALAQQRGENERALGNPEELTSRKPSSEIPVILEQLNLPHGSPESVDVLLASNMLSVGVDIPRLGLMLVNGQPKYMAEYIQATSRVGRREPGLVVTLYNNNKIRDRAHFEAFASWHGALYRSVEPSSVTPFAPRARDKALHAPLVALARHLISPGSPRLPAAERPRLLQIVDDIVERVRDVDPGEAKDAHTELTEFVDAWLDGVRDGRIRTYWNDRQIQSSLLMSAEEAAARRATGRADAPAVPTPNSVRNVEPSVDFVLKERA